MEIDFSRKTFRYRSGRVPNRHSIATVCEHKRIKMPRNIKRKIDCVSSSLFSDRRRRSVPYKKPVYVRAHCVPPVFGRRASDGWINDQTFERAIFYCRGCTPFSFFPLQNRRQIRITPSYTHVITIFDDRAVCENVIFFNDFRLDVDHTGRV